MKEAIEKFEAALNAAYLAGEEFTEAYEKYKIEKYKDVDALKRKMIEKVMLSDARDSLV